MRVVILVLLALAIPGAMAIVMGAVVQLRGERFERVHECRPPSSYWDERESLWITREVVSTVWTCRCGNVWKVGTANDGIWREWERIPPFASSGDGFLGQT